MYSAMDDVLLTAHRVPPFGYLRFVDCVRLHAAFRRFLRPSSALYAKTSAVRSCLFNHTAIYASFLYMVFLFRELLTIFDLVNLVFYNFSERPICLSSVIQFSKNFLLRFLLRDLSKLNRSISSLTTFFRVNVFLLRKEVIHPHVLVGIPCYDLTPITSPTFDGSFLAVRPPASGITSSHGMTGGVYKARERIHRGMLIRDY